MHAKFCRIRKKMYLIILSQVVATLEAQNRELRQRLQNPGVEELKTSPPVEPLQWRKEDVVLVLRRCGSTQVKATLPPMLEELMRVNVRASLESASCECDPVTLATTLGDSWFSVWHEYTFPTQRA